jgi:predicted permease
MKSFAQLVSLFRNLFRGRARDADLDRELQAHAGMLTDEKIAAGMTPAEARRAALIEMEGMQQVKEAVREARTGALLEQLWQDLRFGGRMLRKNPGFTSIAVLTLALGIGANTAIFSLVNAVLLRPLPYHEPEQLVVLRQSYPERGLPFMRLSQANFVAYREQAQSFAGLAAFTRTEYNLAGTAEPARVKAAQVSANFFDVFAAPPLLGRTFRDGEDAAGRRQLAVLSYGYWQRQFGADPGVLGRSLTLNSVPTEVVGVMPAGFAFPDATIEMWVPLDLSRERTSPYNLLGIGRLKPEAQAATAQAETTHTLRTLASGNPGFISNSTPPAPDSQLRTVVTGLQEVVTGRTRTPLLMLLGAVGLVLLIACANVANLLLARGTARAQEIAVRVALGASAARIFRQMMSECLLLGLLGCGVAVALARLALPAIERLPLSAMPRFNPATIDTAVLVFTFGAGLGATLLVGVLPALRARRMGVDAGMQTARGTAGKAVLRTNGALVTLQFALSLVLLVGTGLLLRSFQNLVHVDPGFETENLLTLNMYVHPEKVTGYRNPFAPAPPEEAPRVVRFYQEAVERVRALPGVKAAAIVSAFPFSGGAERDGVVVEGHEPAAGEDAPVMAMRIAGPGYFETMGIKLLRGRDFAAADHAEAMPVVIVDEMLARRYWPDDTAVGKRVRYSWNTEPNAWMTIVGVVSATRDNSLATDLEPNLYLPHTQRMSQGMSLMVRTEGEPGSITRAVQAALREVNPGVPVFGAQTMEKVISGTLAPQKLTGGLLATFAGIALVLAAIGIYGVISLEVSSRSKELAIRSALGAQPGHVFSMVLQRGAILTLAGLLLGAIGAAGLSRLIADLLFGVTPLDAASFAAAVGCLLMVAFLACSIPAWRAAGVNAMVALRQD